MVDQLAAKWLEHAAEIGVPTPNFDRLRQRGVSFSRAISSNPVCMPARATLATGLTTRQHGVLQNGYQLDPAIPTFMRCLQQAGWSTGAFGKVHVRPHYAGLYPDYRQYGFDTTCITEDARLGEWIDWVQREHGEHLDAALSTIWAEGLFTMDGAPEHIKALYGRWRRARDSKPWVNPAYPDARPHAYVLPLPEEVSQTAWITQQALRWLAEADGPLLAHISYVQPHSPFTPPEGYLSRVDAQRLAAPIEATWKNDPDGPRILREKARNAGNEWRFHRQLYMADLTHLDEQLGKVVAALEAAGRLDNTYLIFLADHGEMLYDHDLFAKGPMHYDACVRVPLVIAGPGLDRGVTCDRFVQLEDICPTVLAMAGVDQPMLPARNPYNDADGASPSTTLPGRSLLPLCQGSQGFRGEAVREWRQWAYCESYAGAFAGWPRTIRTERHRYTFYPQGTGEQLFDLEADPDEMTNLNRDPAHAKVRQDLRDRLLESVILQDHPNPTRDLFSLGVH